MARRAPLGLWNPQSSCRPSVTAYNSTRGDIMRQPLSAYLVSISACNGAGERQLAGEGLVGLSWAFLPRRSSQCCRWPVGSQHGLGSADHGGLYKGLTEGKSPAASLRNAKLALLHSKGPHQRPSIGPRSSSTPAPSATIARTFRCASVFLLLGRCRAGFLSRAQPRD